MEPHQRILPHGSWLADLVSPPLLKAGWGLSFNKDLHGSRMQTRCISYKLRGRQTQNPSNYIFHKLLKTIKYILLIEQKNHVFIIFLCNYSNQYLLQTSLLLRGLLFSIISVLAKVGRVQFCEPLYILEAFCPHTASILYAYLWISCNVLYQLFSFYISLFLKSNKKY